MSEKINVKQIIDCHFSTLKHPNNRYIKKDFLAFFALPIVFGFLAALLKTDFDSNTINVIVTASAIFTGLLLNLLVLVYDQKSKTPEPDIKDKNNFAYLTSKHRLLSELYYNISYSTLIAIALVLTCIIHLLVFNIDFSLNSKTINVSAFVTTPLIIVGGLNLLLTLVMIIRRIYALLIHSR